MYKGQIVRKKLSSGDVIGPYCVILGFSGSRCSLVQIESLDGVVKQYVKRERIHAYECTKMVISNRVYERIKKGLQTSIIHDSTPKWKELYEKQPQLVLLRSELYQEKTMVFSVDEIRKVYYRDEILIRLDLDKQLL